MLPETRKMWWDELQELKTLIAKEEEKEEKVLSLSFRNDYETGEVEGERILGR